MYWMNEFLMIGALLSVLWLWVDSLKSRERAIMASRMACDQLNVQLLDDTVVLNKLRLCRTPAGTMALCRGYDFDFTLDGEHRRSGNISMRGQVIEDIVLDVDHTKNIE